MSQSLGHSHNSCATFPPARLVDRTNCRSQVLWLGWCLHLSTESLVCLWKMTGSGSIFPIARSLVRFHPNRFLGVSIVLNFQLNPEVPQGSISLSQYSFPPSFSHLILPLSIPTPQRIQFLKKNIRFKFSNEN